MRKLWKSRGITLPLIILIFAALACNAPTAPSDTDQTATAIVLTMTAGGPVAQVTSQTQAVATPTNPPANSTATFTAAPQQCTAKASQAVNVRTGPSTFHPILRILAEDATGIITGRNNDSSWWQIDGNGWVSAPYVTTSGNCGSIPVASFPPAPPTFTPTFTNTPTATATFTATPVTPTITVTPSATTSGGGVNFTVAWAGIWSCNGTGRISFQVTNTGADALESLQYRIEAPAGTYVNGAMTNTPFGPVPPLPAATCVQAGAESLASSATMWIHPVATMPSGHSARAIIKFCNANDLGGTCKEITYDFTY